MKTTMQNHKRHPARWLLAVTATAALLGFGAVTAEGLSREQVRAELDEARAAGLLDQPGEAGATDEVLRNREFNNQLQWLVATAERELMALQPEDGSAGMPDLASYVEEGPNGPVLVLMLFESDGSLHSSDTLTLASAD
ncbi:MAG: DUF4148 domain-containing protein [Rubrivivax sp.]